MALAQLKIKSDGPVAKGMTVELDGHDLSFCTKAITLYADVGEAQVVMVELLVGEVDIDVPALLELKAQMDEQKGADATALGDELRTDRETLATILPHVDEGQTFSEPIKIERAMFNGAPGYSAERGGVRRVAATEERAVKMLEQIEQGKLKDGQGWDTIPPEVQTTIVGLYGEINPELIGRWTYHKDESSITLRRPDESMKLILRLDGHAAEGETVDLPDWEPREHRGGN